jgi:curli biogenesis system outer membrane secretion channel CsgG
MNISTVRVQLLRQRSRRLRAALLFAACSLWMAAATSADWGLQVEDAPEGGAAVIVAVTPGSPAAVAGLKPGDRVRTAQNFLVRNAGEYQLILRTEKIDALQLRLSRDGWDKEVRLQPPASAKPARPWLGLQVADAPADAAGAPGRGALITGVVAGGPAAQAGLKPGDLVTGIEGRAIESAAAFAVLLEDWPGTKAMRLGVQREGWAREMMVTPSGQPASPQALVPAPPAGAWNPPPAVNAPPPQGTPAEFQPAGNKALVAIGDFRVKAATANQAIGDGLREMLLTALYRSGNYVVVERMDIQGLAAEQALSRSRLAREGSAVPDQQMDVADIMVYGAVTEFEGAAKGSAFQAAVPLAPLSFGRDTSTAHMAIDVRVVDVASGRVLGAQRIVGDAKSSQTALSVTPTVRGVGIPASLGVFSNTPMEQAIRSCVERAVAYVTATVPAGYFRHR